MRSRTTLVLIVLALLVQAFAIVRHSTMVVAYAITASEPSAYAEVPLSLVRDLANSICHSAGDNVTGTILPDEPTKPSDPGTNCPLCNGLATATLLPPPDTVSIEVLALVGTATFAAFDERYVRHRLIRPKSRGPPAADASFSA